MRVLYFLLGLAVYLPLWFLSPYRPAVIPFLLLLPATFCFLFLCRRAARRSKLGIVWLVATGLALRLLFTFQTPSLSEDLYRYFWDGFLVSNGESPYLLAPESMETERSLRPDIYSRMAHRDRRSVYPPVAQVWFSVAWSLWGPSPAGWKLLTLLVEAVLFGLFLKSFRTPPDRLALWALHPLPILEFYSSGHVDLLALTLFVGALALLTRDSAARVATAGGLMAASTLVKVFPAFLVPLGATYWGGRKGLRFAVAFAVASVALACPFLLLVGSPLESARALVDSLAGFNAEWRFNSLPFFLLKSSRRMAGLVATGVFAVVCLVLAAGQRKGDLEDLKTRIYFLLAGLLTLAHTVHPWYVTWILVLYPLLGTRYWAGLYLSCACLASYIAYGLDPPGERVWLLWLEWIPYYLLLARDVAAYHKMRNEPKAPLRPNSAGR